MTEVWVHGRLDIDSKHPQQWGYVRVNAFIVKKKKGNLKIHDKDLA